MSILWLLAGSIPPAACYPYVTCLWCPPSALPGKKIRGERFTSPGKPMAPLCRALYALAACGHDGPVMISSSPLLPEVLLYGLPQDRPHCILTGPDDGAMYWPAAADFIRYAERAIREHDPASGPVMLETVWHQVLLDFRERPE